jgi:hypothetical protein
LTQNFQTPHLQKHPIKTETDNLLVKTSVIETGVCSEQAAGVSESEQEVDPLSIAMDALQELEARIHSTEHELNDIKIKVKILSTHPKQRLNCFAEYPTRIRNSPKFFFA